jgi:hypothetical protein
MLPKRVAGGKGRLQSSLSSDREEGREEGNQPLSTDPKKKKEKNLRHARGKSNC